ncbi:MAG: ABC transporter ATP-binding protein [Gemmatimonadetes bacterium]|nr:ABC transporter ATP-binding protein [Gemmatimonadota bacterium]MBK9069363.1 ABC transporter ATP-binding protein [Gemmatimonadota bacterium]MBK9691932.1 ABC transporter ATP-binding protein [Gemmatimonadota bacterium]
MSYLVLEGLTRTFSSHAGVFGLSLTLARGRTLALLGPSGSGKTTTLRLLGGFEAPDAGSIVVDGADVVALRPEARRFGMVFQHYALFPHLDVGQNVAFGLEARGVRGPAAEARVREALALVDLAGFERRAVTALSGGQQQRVALARALAPEPRVLLLDEPLSNLDPALRERTRRELRALIRRVGITTVIVTHEQEDAFDLGDEIAVLKDGRLEQVGTPEALYQAPRTAFVAEFIGRSSWLRGRVTAVTPAEVTVALGEASWALPAAPIVARIPGLAAGQGVRLLVRPEALAFTAPGAAGLTGLVEDRRFAGASAFYRVRLRSGELVELAADPAAAAAGDRVTLAPAQSRADRGERIVCFAEDGR